jgi:hypothetical protein
MSTSLLEPQLTTYARARTCPDPECAAPAYIEDRWSLESTDGPIEMVKVRCAAGCWYTLPADRV